MQTRREVGMLRHNVEATRGGTVRRDDSVSKFMRPNFLILASASALLPEAILRLSAPLPCFPGRRIHPSKRGARVLRWRVCFQGRRFSARRGRSVPGV